MSNQPQDPRHPLREWAQRTVLGRALLLQLVWLIPLGIGLAGLQLLSGNVTRGWLVLVWIVASVAGLFVVYRLLFVLIRPFGRKRDQQP